MKSSIEIIFAGHALVLDASGALYWPAENVLVASDLHLEKSTFLAQHGSLIPPYDSQDTLERLAQAVALYRPRELLLLGDSFHDAQGWNRLNDSLRAQLATLATQVEAIRWIEGNHDVSLRSQGAVEFLATHVIKDILFTHEHAPGAPSQIIGHYHPKHTVHVRNRTLRERCFAVNERLLMMPAFGSYTGGLNITHEAIQVLTEGQALKPYLLYREKIYAFPAA